MCLDYCRASFLSLHHHAFVSDLRGRGEGGRGEVSGNWQADDEVPKIDLQNAHKMAQELLCACGTYIHAHTPPSLPPGRRTILLGTQHKPGKQPEVTHHLRTILPILPPLPQPPKPSSFPLAHTALPHRAQRTFLVSGQEQQIFFPLLPSLGGSASTGLDALAPMMSGACL